MALEASRIKSAIGNISAMQRLFAHGSNDGRVAHCFIGDSTALMNDRGMSEALSVALSSTLPCFGTGLISARHKRSKYVTGGGGGWFWPTLGGSTVPSSPATCNNIYLYVASANVTSRSTTSLTFSSNLLVRALADHRPGIDYVYITSDGTPNLWIWSPVVSVTNSGATLTWTDSLSTTGNVTVYYCPGPGGSSIKDGAGTTLVPAAYAQAWNMPPWWLPHETVFQPGTSAAYSNAVTGILWRKESPLPPNGKLQVNTCFFSGLTTPTSRCDIYSYKDDLSGFTYNNTSGIPNSDTLGSITVLAPYATTNGSIASTGSPNYKWQRATMAGLESGTTRYIDLEGSDNWCGVQGNKTSAATKSMMMAYMAEGNAGVAGPALIVGGYISNSTMTFGHSFSMFASCGGKGTYDLVQMLSFCDTQTLKTYFTVMGDMCSTDSGGTGTRRCCVWINMGYNDSADSRTSIGDGPHDLGYTATGFMDNTRKAISILRAAWDSLYGAGTSATELCFAIVPSAPTADDVTDADETNLTSHKGKEVRLRRLRTAARTIAESDPFAFSIDLAELLGPNGATRLNNGRLTAQYASDDTSGDVIHMSQAGARFIAAHIVEACSFVSGTGSSGPNWANPLAIG